MKGKLFIGFAVLLMTSCASRKNFLYFQDMEMGESYPIAERHETVLHCDDRLSIKVSSKNPELAIPFNATNSAVRVNTNGKMNVEGSGESNDRGYLVDPEGMIDFPILGKLHVEGLSVLQVADLIKKKIIEGDYIKEPLVDVELLNFKYTVLGAVGSNGVYTATDGRVTLVEAIAKAGDISAKAKIDKIAVIREKDGKRQVFMHDLRSRDIFDSPCYYLQQNDIVYVEPKYKKKDTEDRGVQYIGLAASMTTAVTTLLMLLLR
jgi:polysaccharide export outer membrane protein